MQRCFSPLITLPPDQLVHPQIIVGAVVVAQLLFRVFTHSGQADAYRCKRHFQDTLAST